MQTKYGKVPKEYAAAEGLLYRQKSKLLRLIVLRYIKQFVLKNMSPTYMLVFKGKSIHIKRVAL